MVPTDGPIGADINGVDFTNLDAAVIAEIRQAWLDYSVVRFRGQKISDEDQIALTGLLGEFVKHPRQLKGEEGAHPKYEEILVIANGDESGMPAGTMGNSECRWHSDTYIHEFPPAAAILKAGRVRKGYTRPDTDDHRLWPNIRHPLVRTHGETGRNSVYLGAEANSAWIVGLPWDESTDILAKLWAKVEDPKYVWTQVWQPNDMIMWDNRCTKHRRDGWSSSEIRTMHRTTTKGEKPVFIV